MVTDEHIDHRFYQGSKYEEALWTGYGCCYKTKRKQSGWLKLLKQTAIQYFTFLDRLGTAAASGTTAAEQAIRERAEKRSWRSPTFTFKRFTIRTSWLMLPALGVHALAESEEIVIPDNTGRASSAGLAETLCWWLLHFMRYALRWKTHPL